MIDLSNINTNSLYIRSDLQGLTGLKDHRLTQLLKQLTPTVIGATKYYRGSNILEVLGGDA